MSFTPQQSNVPPSQLHAAQQGSMMQGYTPGLLPTGLPPPPMPPPFPVFSVPPPSQPVMKQPAVLTGRPMISPRFTKRVGDTRPQYRPPIGDKPTVTVFVGNITEHASDALIRQLLMKCGIVVNWKRVQGADGKLQAFGFCEYIDAETGLRAIRLLHDLTVGDKNLVVKVDAKTKEMLEEYKKKKAAAKGSDTNSEPKVGEEVIDEETKKEDVVVMKTIQGLMSDNADVLSGKFAGTVSKWRATHSGSEENLEGMGMDKAQKHLISKEIRFFRDTYKDSEKQKADSGKDEKENDKENKDKENVRDGEKSGEKSREKSREKERPRDRGGERDYGERRRDEDRNRDRSRSRDRNNSSRDERDKERRQNRDRDLDEEEQYEKRKRERKQKERNQIFLDRLKNWEGRERKKYREYERELEKDREQENEQLREKKHLLEFLEDYDDEQDDPKYYRGSSFDRRMQARLQEMELDDKDRQRELEEIEEIRKTLGEPITTTAAPAPMIATVKEEEPMEEEETAVPTVQPEPEQKPMLQATFKPATHVVESAPKVSSPALDSPIVSPKAATVANNKTTQEEKSEADGESTANKKAFGFEMKKTNVAGSSKKLEAVFNSEEDATNDQTGKRKLVPLEYSEEEMKAVAAVKTAEDKKKSIKALIERIPTAKDELFAYTLDWECVDQMLIDRRIRPWVNKKIVEYIGEEEPSLVDFMCSKLLARSQPENILHDVSMVLDDEAEVFVVKMWRLLIYETEAKKIGLVK